MSFGDILVSGKVIVRDEFGGMIDRDSERGCDVIVWMIFGPCGRVSPVHQENLHKN
jgi:hypothetical protein